MESLLMTVIFSVMIHEVNVPELSKKALTACNTVTFEEQEFTDAYCHKITPSKFSKIRVDIECDCQRGDKENK